MATYAELFNLRHDSALINRISVAVSIAAEAKLVAATPTAAELAWAVQVLSNPGAEAQRVLYTVLAANKDATVAAIQGASDAAIQTNVEAVLDGLIAAG